MIVRVLTKFGYMLTGVIALVLITFNGACGGQVRTVTTTQIVTQTTTQSSPPVRVTVTIPALSFDDQIAIYVSLIRHIFKNNPRYLEGIGHTLDVYTDTADGWRTFDRVDPYSYEKHVFSIPKELQSAVTAGASGLPFIIAWVEEPNYPYLTLGNVYPQPDGSVQAAAEFIYGNLGSDGANYILHKVDGVWQVDGFNRMWGA
jgi:hypothetical protein